MISRVRLGVLSGLAVAVLALLAVGLREPRPGVHATAPIATGQAPPGEETQPRRETVAIPPPWPNGQSPKAPPAGGRVEAPAGDGGDGHVRRVEETGPDLTAVSEDRLIDALAGSGTPEPWADIRAAWELGNRFLSGAWQPDPGQRQRVDAATERLLDDARLQSADYYAASRSQLYRLWSLAHPVLLRTLDARRRNPDLIIKTLAATRTRELIQEMVSQYRSESDPGRKKLLAFTLSCMKEQRRVLILRRQVMGMDESERLYAELIAPALR